MFEQTQLNVIEYIALECARQGSGEESVYDMVNAWDYADKYAQLKDPKINLNFIEFLGRYVEPVDNRNGFRTIPIYISNGWESIEKTPWERVKPNLTHLIDAYYGEPFFEPTHDLAISKEDQFYYEYENIHPFRDGNGRTGKIIYNYLLGRLDDPIMPPNFWGSSNP